MTRIVEKTFPDTGFIPWPDFDVKPVCLETGTINSMDLSLLNALAHLESPAGLIALPGPEHYVLAARPSQPEAMERLRRLKNASEPILLLGCDLDAIAPYVAPLPPAALKLVESHWPGPLVLMVAGHVGHCVSQGEQPVKILQPDISALQDFLALNPGGVLATLCASRMSDPPAITAKAVYDGFGDDVDYVIENDDAFRDTIALTVVSVTVDNTVHLLRNGGIVLD